MVATPAPASCRPFWLCLNLVRRGLCLLCSFSRPPLRINPEAIIQHSGLEALQVTAFLAENYPHFFAEDAMEQAATAAAYLSDAGELDSSSESGVQGFHNAAMLCRRVEAAG